jgi:hypothetical protein
MYRYHIPVPILVWLKHLTYEYLPLVFDYSCTTVFTVHRYSTGMYARFEQEQLVTLTN